MTPSTSYSGVTHPRPQESVGVRGSIGFHELNASSTPAHWGENITGSPGPPVSLSPPHRPSAPVERAALLTSGHTGCFEVHMTGITPVPSSIRQRTALSHTASGSCTLAFLTAAGYSRLCIHHHLLIPLLVDIWVAPSLGQLGMFKSESSGK